VKQVTADSISGFLRGAELGISLGEAELVVNATVYLWNYHQHYIRKQELTKLIDVFKPLLASMKRVDMSKDSVLLTRVASALVGGVVTKCTPKPSEIRTPTAKKGRAGNKCKDLFSVLIIYFVDSKSAKKGKDEPPAVDTGPELKEALEVHRTIPTTCVYIHV